jgi:hypothetical protein
MNNNWDKCADYYLSLANRQGDPYCQRSLLWYAEICRTRAICDEVNQRPPSPSKSDPPASEK